MTGHHFVLEAFPEVFETVLYVVALKLVDIFNSYISSKISDLDF